VPVPKAVREELFKRRAAKDRLQNLFDTYAFFQRCDGYERGTVEFLLAHDDLETHGTFWVLTRFHELNLLSSLDTRTARFVCLAASPWNAIAVAGRQ